MGLHPATPAGSKPKTNKRLLVIDDEKMVGSVLKAILEFNGYEVLLESSSVDALKTFRYNAEDFDLVITDLVMPMMSGFDIAREFKKIRPDVPIILCSGSLPVEFPAYQTEHIQAFMLKPFTGKELMETIGTVFDEQTNKNGLGQGEGFDDYPA